MARRSQSSSQGDNPLAPGYLPPHYKEYYRLAVDALAEGGPEAYSRFLASEGAPAFLCPQEVEHVNRHLRPPQHASRDSPEGSSSNVDLDGSSGTYWPMNSDQAVPELDLGWPLTFGFQGTEVTTLVQPPPLDSPSIKDEARRMIRSAQQVPMPAREEGVRGRGPLGLRLLPGEWSFGAGCPPQPVLLLRISQSPKVPCVLDLTLMVIGKWQWKLEDRRGDGCVKDPNPSSAICPSKAQNGGLGNWRSL